MRPRAVVDVRRLAIFAVLVAGLVGGCAQVVPPMTVERAVQAVAGVAEQGAAVDGGVILVRLRPGGPRAAEVIFAQGGAAGQAELEVIATVPYGDGSSAAMVVCGTDTPGGARTFYVGSSNDIVAALEPDTDGLVVASTPASQEESSERAYVFLPPVDWVASLDAPDLPAGDRDLVVTTNGQEILRIRAADVDRDGIRAGLAAPTGCAVDGVPSDAGPVAPTTCTAPVDAGPEADGPSPYALFVALRCGAAVVEARSNNAGLACTYDLSDKVLEATFTAPDARAISRLDIAAQHNDVVERLGSHVDKQLVWATMSLTVSGSEYIVSTIEPGASIGSATGLFGDGGWMNLVVDAIQPDGTAIKVSFICDRVARRP